MPELLFHFCMSQKKIEKGDNMSECWGGGGGGQLPQTKFFNISFLKLAINISVTCTKRQYEFVLYMFILVASYKANTQSF